MRLGGASALSVVAWAAGAWAFYLVLGWMNIHVPPADAVAATVIIQVATLWFAVLLGLAAATLPATG